MKGLSEKAKAEAYDKIVDMAKKELNACGSKDCDAARQIFRFFPELAESNDEKIRKDIISYLALYKDAIGEEYESWIAWLEKQGAKVSAIEGFETEFERQVSSLIASTINKEHEYNQGYVKWTANALLNYAKHELEKQGIPKPIDKVEPKFKAGDWIVFNGLTLYINEVVKGYYRTISIGGITNSYDWDIDNVARFWTIQDAKDGDVLVIEEGRRNDECIFIFKSIAAREILEYCYLRSNNTFSPTGSFIGYVDNVYHPATKEQRDILFKAMKESGYEWDAEKKELRKIEQNSWSEDDKERIKNIISVLDVQVCWDGATGKKGNPYQKEIDWLKSLRPQPHWKPSDKQLEALKKTCDEHWEPDGLDPLYTLYKDLKILKE